jgi:hypothetical protein
MTSYFILRLFAVVPTVIRGWGGFSAILSPVSAIDHYVFVWLIKRNVTEISYGRLRSECHGDVYIYRIIMNMEERKEDAPPRKVSTKYNCLVTMWLWCRNWCYNLVLWTAVVISSKVETAFLFNSLIAIIGALIGVDLYSYDFLK